jgi:hypothetical protein
VSAPEQTPSNDQGTWLQGRDILPANIPSQAAEPKPAAPPPPESPPPRRPRRWSLILGVPLFLIIVLIVVAVVTTGGGLTGRLPGGTAGTAAASGTAEPGIQTAVSIDGDPLLSARVETSPPIPKAPVLYLEAQAKGDGQTAWNELSAAAQSQIAQQGGSAAALTAELKQSPLPPVKQITFVGGSVMNDGREATMFVVTADVNGALRQVPYYFTVDTQGKIDEVH